MCACDSGTPCQAHRGTRHDPAYFDPQNEVSRPEEAPAESWAFVLDANEEIERLTRGLAELA